MAESVTQKKKKGMKKSESDITSAVISANNMNCSSLTINSINHKSSVPQELNIKTPENIEITPVQSMEKQNSELINKKKKKSKKKTKEVLKDAAENNDSKPLLNFSENGISLVNHPEISVTLTDSFESKNTDMQSVKDEVLPAEEEKQNENPPVSTTKKKKKKKKKNCNLPPTSVNENAFTAPSYTKVVTSDNTCVLVVNNEISVSTKSSGNPEGIKNKIPENSIDFSIPSEKQLGDVLRTKNLTPDTNIKLGNSVSIYPVLTQPELNISDQETVASSDQNVETTARFSKQDIVEISVTSEESKLTKSQLKAERRAKQEAQRAAKLAKSNSKMDVNSQNTIESKSIISSKEKSSNKETDVTNTEYITEKMPSKLSDKEGFRKVRLFSHLPLHKQFDANVKIPPAILEIGFQYNKGIICGSNARCIALLGALREIIKDHSVPPAKNFCRDLESNIQLYLNFLNNCRPLSVSMVNAVKFLKHQINHISSEMEIDKTKEKLCKFINDFVNEEILLAKEAIGNSASAKIVDGDVILVFAHSSLVKDVLCKAYNEKKIFRVIIADSRPKLEGLKMLRYLVKQGLHCSYISINAVSYVMKEVSKVIIGAHALLSNGCVMSRLGSKQVALVASSYSVPVLVCCETYKFCERVLTDSFVHNELGEPEDIIAAGLVPNESLKIWHDLSSLQLLNLLYDVTPPDLISMVITEKGVLPCTSVPVVLRVRYAGLHE